jgi:hypothetical protein
MPYRGFTQVLDRIRCPIALDLKHDSIAVTFAAIKDATHVITVSIFDDVLVIEEVVPVHALYNFVLLIADDIEHLLARYFLSCGGVGIKRDVPVPTQKSRIWHYRGCG